MWKIVQQATATATSFLSTFAYLTTTIPSYQEKILFLIRTENVEPTRQIGNYVEIWMWMYNNERPHSALQYLTPRDFFFEIWKTQLK